MVLFSLIGSVLSVLVTVFIAFGGIQKIIGTSEMVSNFEFMKLQKYRIMTGIGELLGGVLLSIPQTSLFGLLLITSFMSAAVVMHLSLMGGNKTWLPLLIGIVAVISFFLRM